jgi:outer membrane protein assembly factor BamB
MIKFSPERFEPFHGWRWSVSPARSIATPAAQGNSVLFGGGFGSHEIYCVDARSGTTRWELRLRDDGPTAATLLDGTAFLNTESCTLVAVDIATGKLLWERWLGDPLLAQPAAADGRVFMAWPARGRHALGAFACDSGAQLWAAEVEADIITAPIVEGARVYVTTFDGCVSCFDARSGERRWTRDLQATSAPWIFRDDAFVAHRRDIASRGRMRARASATSEEAMALEAITRLKAAAGHDSGMYPPKDARYLSSRYGAARKSAFGREDAAVGFGSAPAAAKLHFARSLIGEAHVSRAWRFQGSRPVVANGVLFETWDGRILSLDAATGRERWSIDVGAPVHWQPILCAGRVFAGLENGDVIGFATGDAGDDGWPMWGGGPGHNGPEHTASDTAGAASNAAIERVATSARHQSRRRERAPASRDGNPDASARGLPEEAGTPDQGLLLFDYGRSPEGLPRIDTSDLFPDPWRPRVYAETLKRLPQGRVLTIDGAQRLVDAVCRRFDRAPIPAEPCPLPVPAFEFDERTGAGLRLLFPATCDAGLRVNEHIVLHEISHYLAVSAFQRETHGPLFLGYFLASASEYLGADCADWHRAFAEVGLHALTGAQINAVRSLSHGQPMDVEAFRDVVAAFPDVAPEVRAYYDATPPSHELAHRVARVYAKHDVC